MSPEFPLLVIEGSSAQLSVALYKDPQTAVTAVSPPDERSFSEKILVLIDHLLNQEGLSVQSVRCLGVSRGPGSFTSLRVGLSTALGLSLSQDIPVHTYSSLQAMLGPYPGGATVAPFLKAGRGQIYGACYGISSTGGMPEVLLAEGVFNPQEFIARVQKISPDAKFCGPEAALLPSVEVELRYPEAFEAGRVLIQSPCPLDPGHLTVNYLKEPDLGGK